MLKDDSIQIGLTGDVMIGRTLDKVIDEHGYEYPWGTVLPLMRNVDANIINLETTLTKSNRKVYKTYNFKATPDKVHSLLHANVSVANLANNHILDFATEGMLETIRTLDDANIKHTGAGLNYVEAGQPVFITRKGIRIGVLGMTDNEPEWRANGVPGIHYVNLDDLQEKNRALKIIEKTKREADVVVVSIHWGPNMRVRPSSLFVQFAHAMINSGATLVHGHSSHILQGIEHYKNGLILYDTGDFVDDYVFDSRLRNDLSAYFIVKANAQGILELRILPVHISNCQVNLARGQEYKQTLERIQFLSRAFNTTIQDDGVLSLNVEIEQDT